MNRTPAQPCNAVGADGDVPQSFVELEENLLRHFFRNRRVMEEVAGDAVNHPLVFPDDGFKFGLRHLPSELITNQDEITTQKVLRLRPLWYPRPVPLRIAFCLLLVALSALRAEAQIAVSANDGDVELVNGVNTPRSNPEPDTVTILNTSVMPPRVLGEVRAPNSVLGPPHNIAIAPDGSIALVASSTRIDPANPRNTIPDNRVTVIDLAAKPPVVVDTLQAGRSASGVAINREGTLALVANRGEGTVSVFIINGKILTPTGKVDLGAPDSQPAQVMFSADGRNAFVSRSAATDNKISVLSVELSKVEYTKRDFFTGLQPYGMDLTPAGDLAVVANIGTGFTGGSDTVSLVDVKVDPPRAIDQIAVGPIPEGIVISPNGKYVAVTVLNGTNVAPTSPFFHDYALLKVFEIRNRRLVAVAETKLGHWCQGVGFTAKSDVVMAQCMVEREIQLFAFDGKTLKRSGQIKINGGPAGLRTVP
jgi:DNA-binding beta-propeller fold protein YncE